MSLPRVAATILPARVQVSLRFLGLVLGLVFLLQAPKRGEAQLPWPLWEAYSRQYLDEQGRVIDRSAGDRTTSEGQAYAMFFALVDDDRPRFDKLLGWTEANLAGGDLSLRLPAWSWGHSPAGTWGVLDANSASDADLWLAYDLIEAGRLWRDPRLSALGNKLIERIALQEVVTLEGVGTWLAPGPQGFHSVPDAFVLNPSYMPPALLQRMSTLFPKGPWKAISASVPTLLAAGVGNGFAMDWVEVSKTGVRAVAPPAQAGAGQQAAQASGSYDAIRVYLWLGLANAATPGVRSELKLLGGMRQLIDRGAFPPEQVDATGRILKAEAPVGFLAAVIPYSRAVGDADVAARMTGRLMAARDGQTGLFGRPATYYDQNLTLFSTASSEGRFHFARDGVLHVGW